jgi:hypothetical protein
MSFDDLYPGAETPFGVVAYATTRYVWVYTLAGVRAYRLAPEPVPATKAVAEARPRRLYIVSRRAA